MPMKYIPHLKPRVAPRIGASCRWHLRSGGGLSLGVGYEFATSVLDEERGTLESIRSLSIALLAFTVRFTLHLPPPPALVASMSDVVAPALALLALLACGCSNTTLLRLGGRDVHGGTVVYNEPDSRSATSVGSQGVNLSNQTAATDDGALGPPPMQAILDSDMSMPPNNGRMLLDPGDDASRANDGVGIAEAVRDAVGQSLKLRREVEGR